MTDGYSGSVVISEHVDGETQWLTIDSIAPKIRVALEVVLAPAGALDAVTIEREGGSGLLHLTGRNGTVTYRIDGFDLATLVLMCSLVHDGRDT